jgi:hypothetical protein
MQKPDFSKAIHKLRPFVPAKDFETSKRFYADLGFQIRPLGADLAEMGIGTHSFLLQNFFVEEWASNFMMHVLMTNLDAWWKHIAALDLPGRYGVPSPKAPKLEPWGLNVAYVIDPSGVLWHIAEERAGSSPRT